MPSNSNYIQLDISEERSSLISRLKYWIQQEVLVVYLRHGKPKYRSYGGVSMNHFDELVKAKSIGKLYLSFIKPNFTQLNSEDMSDEKKRPPTKNLASNEKRFIKISINVQEIDKKWLLAGEKGTYLAMTLHMLPDGTVDKYGNLGMITQDVPKWVYDKEKELSPKEKSKGAILGNAAELDWPAREGTAGASNTSGPLPDDVADDLPF